MKRTQPRSHGQRHRPEEDDHSQHVDTRDVENLRKYARRDEAYEDDAPGVLVDKGLELRRHERHVFYALDEHKVYDRRDA